MFLMQGTLKAFSFHYSYFLLLDKPAVSDVTVQSGAFQQKLNADAMAVILRQA